MIEMELRFALLLCLCFRLRAAASEHADADGSLEMQSDGPRRSGASQLCQLNQKELHTTVRSAALSALKGLCDPAEAEARLLAIEERLTRKLEQIKDSVSRVLEQISGYDEDEDDTDYDEGTPSDGDEDSGVGLESSEGELTHYNEYRTQKGRANRHTRRKSYKRYGSTFKGGNTGSSRQDASRSAVGQAAQSRSEQGATVRSASSRAGNRRSNVEASSRAHAAASRDGSYGLRSPHTQDHFASAQTTRSSSVRSVSQEAYRAAARQRALHTGDTHNTTKNDSTTYKAGSGDSGVTPDQRRSSGGVSRSGHRYAQVPRSNYANTARQEGPGSIQYTTHDSSEHASGVRQVSSRALGSRAVAASKRGNSVAFSSSYTPSATPEPYYNYSQPGRGGQSRRQGRRYQSGRRYRGQHSSASVGYVSSSESALRSRFREVRAFNDTVYEMNGKRMYSYYWEVKDFDTMMATWEERHSLRSPSFYVYQGGYRMYMRVFPSRQGGNIYLHAGLTPGRYDATLRWPFRLRLRLSMLDHSAVADDIRSRIWNPTDLCSGWNWRRPTDADNYECVGLGFPQQLVRDRRYILDGSVLIKLDVFLEE